VTRAVTRATALLVVAVLVATGCGDSDQANAAAAGPATSTPNQSRQTSAPTDLGTPSGDLTPADVTYIEHLLVTFDLEGGCQFMTDAFLEDQTFLDDPEAACAGHEAAVTPKSYTADDIIISDITGNDDRARATLGSDIADLTVTVQLVKRDGMWLINGYNL